MRNSALLLIFTLLLFLFSCQNKESGPIENTDEYIVQSIDTFTVASSIRALQVIDEQKVWFAGSGGVFGFTQDGGNSWTIDSIRQDSFLPHFRSVAVTNEASFLLSIASPALLYRSEDQGQNWDIVYQEDHPSAFYDAMVFWDDQYGVAMGDPTDGCLSVIRTTDGGKNWQKVSCENIPEAAEGEAAFAASNSNLSVEAGGKVWMVSGGQRARVYYSSDYGENWDVADTPIKEGGQMTGIYSVDFFNDQNGIVFGGDWNEKSNNYGNVAISSDGGKNWQLIAEGKGPGYRSLVQFLPNSSGNQIIAVGSPGISLSKDGGRTWEEVAYKGFYTADIFSKKGGLWLAGAGKVGKISFQ